MTFIVNARVKNGVPQGQIYKSKELYCVVPQIKGLDEHFPDQLKVWRYDVIWWRNDVKSFSKRNKTHLFTPWVHVCPKAGMWVNACPNGEPESMHARMWGGLLQDTVSLMGDMVHSLFYVPLKNFPLIWRRHHCRWRAAKFKPMLGAQGPWAGRDLYRATLAVTRGPGFSSLIQRTAPSSRLLRHARGCGWPILTQILTGLSQTSGNRSYDK
jgi:hypothetical protein